MHMANDPNPKLRKRLTERGISENDIQQIERGATALVAEDFARAVASPEPDPARVAEHVFANSHY